MLNFFLKYLNTQDKKEKGFTLIELIIVVAVIAILAAIATPKGVALVEKSKASRIVADVKSLKTAALLYYEENGSYDDLNDISVDLGDYLDQTITSNDEAAYAVSSTAIIITIDNDNIRNITAEKLGETALGNDITVALN